jgi:hypothetical protein
MDQSEVNKYRGQIVGVQLHSDPHNTLFGFLWISPYGCYISDDQTINGVLKSTSVADFLTTRSLWGNEKIEFDDVASIYLVANGFFSSELMADIKDTANKIAAAMINNGYLGYVLAGPTNTIDMNKYPHKCSCCGSPAYDGLFSTECSNTTCRNYKA